MDNQRICNNCGVELKLIPAGISKKTGRPYSDFWACPNGHKQAPGANPAPRPATAQSYDWAPTSASKTSPNMSPAVIQPNVDQQVWDSKDLRIARESCLSTVAKVMAAKISRPDVEDKPLSDLIDQVINEADKLVDFVYNGNNQDH